MVTKCDIGKDNLGPREPRQSANYWLQYTVLPKLKVCHRPPRDHQGNSSFTIINAAIRISITNHWVWGVPYPLVFYLYNVAMENNMFPHIFVWGSCV